MTANHSARTDVALLGGCTGVDGLTVTRRISLEPTTWWEWQCPSCQSTFERTGLCPQCHTRLRRTQVSLPFIWIG